MQANKLKEWVNNWKEIINKYYKNNSKQIKKWVILKSYEKIYDTNKNSQLYLIYELNEVI